MNGNNGTELARRTVTIPPQPADGMSLIALGQMFAKSGYFQDSRDAAQAAVKIQAGAELGFPPVVSMTGVYIVKGKVSLSANLVAAAIKRSGRYTYRVLKLDDKECEIEFFENGQSIGKSVFTIADAKRAGTQNIEKFPRNMLFARAMSNGARWYTPDVFGGPIYTPDELGERVDAETGEVATPASAPPSAAGTQEEARNSPEETADDAPDEQDALADTATFEDALQEAFASREFGVGEAAVATRAVLKKKKCALLSDLKLEDRHAFLAAVGDGGLDKYRTPKEEPAGATA